jgi:hypothetical protein
VRRALLVVILLAGCTAPPVPKEVPPASPFFLAAADLEAGGFYAFEHPGGSLTMRLEGDGSAQFALFEPSGIRLGGFGLGGGAGAVRFDALAAGVLVVRFEALEPGSLRVEAGQAREVPKFWPLREHVERVILAAVTDDPLPSVPFVPLRPTETALVVDLLRPPALLRLFVDDGHNDLDVLLGSAKGPVLAAASRGLTRFPGTSPWMHEVPASFHAENAQAHLEGMLRASDLKGTVLLESVSFSLAMPPGQERVGTQGAPAPFSYGLLPSAPVEFEAPDGHLVFSGEGWAAVFDAQDRRLANVPIKPGSFATLQVSEGKHVVALLSGNATLGATARPAQAQLTPLEVRAANHPTSPAGRGATYGQSNASLSYEGVLFDAVPVWIRDPFDLPNFPLMCFPESAVILRQGNETVAAWGRGWPEDPSGHMLQDGELEAIFDGYGRDNCSRLGVRLVSYVR